MRIGLAYDLKDSVPLIDSAAEDALEEYDSRETVERTASFIEAGGHEVVMLGGGREFLNNILREKVDLVFNIAEGLGNYRSREAQIPSVLEMLGIPYSGSDPQCLAICLDKPLTKKLVAAEGISTPGGQVISSREEVLRMSRAAFSFPIIIKPVHEGSSKGIHETSLAHDFGEMEQEVGRLIDGYRQPVMVEEFITGDEVTVGIVGKDPADILGAMRILPKKKEEHFVYSLEVKRDYKNRVEYECPARLKDEYTENLKKSSLKVFETLGCRDFARIDYRIGSDGTPYFIDINPLPGLGSHSDLVIMALKLGWTHEGLVNSVLNAALMRYPQCAHV
jgi:D-alanine-D-alanine ligase